MNTFKQRHAVSGIVYVYSREKVIDKQTGIAKVVRKVIGKIDPETGETVPTGNVGRPPKQPTDSNNVGVSSPVSAEISDFVSQIEALKRELEIVKRNCEKKDGVLQQIARLISDN